jgi:hypothetical protein
MALTGMLLLICASCEERAPAAEMSANASAIADASQMAAAGIPPNIPLGAAPGQAVLVSPSGILSSGRPTYIWNTVSNTDYYCLLVKDSLEHIVLKLWYSADDFPAHPATCSVTPCETLGPGDYTWKIETWNDEGGQESNALAFTVCTSTSFPGKATLISPKGTIGTSKPTYIWSAVTGCTEYRLKVINVNNPNPPLLDAWYDASEVLSDQGCSIPSDLVLGAGYYRWWIQTRNCKGDGPWSSYALFNFANKSPGPATPISPRGLISTFNPRFIWTAVKSATQYHLHLENATKTVIDTTYRAEDVTSGSRCYAYLPIALPDDDIDYFWRIAASNDAGDGPWSSLKYFETVCSARSGPAQEQKKDSAARQGRGSLRAPLRSS